MEHALDPRTPMHTPDGVPLTAEERYAFFENVAERLSNRYRSNRLNEFSLSLSVGDQLDMLWHELNSNGSISKDGPWFNAVKAVKEAHPKDDSAYQQAVAEVALMRQQGSGDEESLRIASA